MARRWLIGAGVVWILLTAVVVSRVVWNILDHSELLGAAATSSTPLASVGDTAYVWLYTAAYLCSIAPAMVVVTLLLIIASATGQGHPAVDPDPAGRSDAGDLAGGLRSRRLGRPVLGGDARRAPGGLRHQPVGA